MEPTSNISISSTSDYKILIVEDEYIIANDLEIILHSAGYPVIGIAKSVSKAKALIEEERPDMVLLDIYLKGGETGIELAKELEQSNIPFIYTSANDNQSVLESVKDTKPSGYIVKPFRKKDILSALQTGRTLHAQRSEPVEGEVKVLENELIKASSDTENWDDNLLTIARLIQKHVPFDLFTIRRHNQAKADIFNYHRVGFDEYQILSVHAIQKMTVSSASIGSLSSQTSKPESTSVYGADQLGIICSKDSYIELLVKTFKMESGLATQLRTGSGDSISVCFLSKKPDIYNPHHQLFLDNINQSLTVIAESILGRQVVN